MYSRQIENVLKMYIDSVHIDFEEGVVSLVNVDEEMMAKVSNVLFLVERFKKYKFESFRFDICFKYLVGEIEELTMCNGEIMNLDLKVKKIDRLVIHNTVINKMYLRFDVMKLELVKCSGLKVLAGKKINMDSMILDDCVDLEEIALDMSGITNDIYIKGCIKLAKLTKLPRKIDNNIIISRVSMDVIDFLPKVIGGDLSIFDCDNLVRIENFCDRVVGTVTIRNCNNLVKLPSYYGVFNNLFINNCGKLRRFFSGIYDVSNMFSCENCDSLETLEGSPRKVGYIYNIRECINLRSLKGCSSVVGDNFVIMNCPNLKVIDYLPSKIGKNIKMVGVKIEQVTYDKMVDCTGFVKIRKCSDDNLYEIKRLMPHAVFEDI